MNEWRVQGGDRFQIVTSAVITSVCFFRVVVTDDQGQDQRFEGQHTPTSDRVTSSTILSGIVRGNGYVTRATAGVLTDEVKRGELFAEIAILDRNERNAGIMAADYIGDHMNLNLGTIRQPTDGKGRLIWVQEANDAAGNATTTVNLAVANARRIVRQVVVKIHSSGDVATRTWTMTLRDLADSGGPTNWSIASDTWVSPTLTLTANEEGLMHVAEHGFVSVNDAGSLSYADNSSSPNPFPMEVEEGEPGDLIIVAGAGEAADDYDVWVQYEEWIEV